ncbi:hypothetical protein [Micromonospora sp. NPDC092111]|uniref:hypothetical protein n=1 Tax=Micromonospora sp. NPDC092111 TaxID=3364289 RepID=UPI003824C799
MPTPAAASADDLDSPLDLLDGTSSTLASAQVGPWEVMIGGGPDRFVLTAQSATAVLNGVRPDSAADSDDATVDLTVGAQAVDYPARYVLDRGQVSRALDALHRGALHDGSWEHLEV